jgi:hypothetical protein
MRGVKMLSRSGITKLKAILAIDILIVSFAAGAYFYLQAEGLINSAPVAVFTLSDLTINPINADLGEPVTISVNVTNVGNSEGVYAANLTVNDVIKDNQTIILSVDESTILEFTDRENAEGTYNVTIGDLSDNFTVKAVLPIDSDIILSKLFIDPYEANIGGIVKIRAEAKNSGAEDEQLPVKLSIDDTFVETRLLELAPEESTTLEFTVNATTDGGHRVKLNSLSSSFSVVPAGMHTFGILISPNPSRSVDITLNGKTIKAPYQELLPEGQYTVSMPGSDTSGKHPFLHWNDGTTNPTKTITLANKTILVAYYEAGASCPSLFTWNGTSYHYISEASNAGWLGYIGYINGDGAVVFQGGNPWDYIKLDNSQLQVRDNSYYDMTLSQIWDEIYYLDSAYLMVVDHPANVDVYSTMVRYINPEFMGQIYTTSKQLATPVSAYNEKGENVLPQISKKDGVFTPGVNIWDNSTWDNFSWNILTLDLGDLSNAEQITLVMTGMVDWGQAQDYYDWIDSFLAQKVPNGTQVLPPPFMEVKDLNGNWIRVPENRQIPIASDYTARTFAVNLTGLFPTNDYSLRINNFWNVTYDYIGISTNPEEELTIQRIDPIANLYQAEATDSSATGNFTRYGDVTELLLAADEKFVIGMQGDAVSLHFPIAGIAPLQDGWERDFFLFVAAWFKDEPSNWGYGFEFTVDPLPFRDMSGFPYPDTERYPYDSEHLNYIQQYNTRVITPPKASQPQEAALANWAIATMLLVAVVDVGLLIYFKKRVAKLGVDRSGFSSDKPRG